MRWRAQTRTRLEACQAPQQRQHGELRRRQLAASVDRQRRQRRQPCQVPEPRCHHHTAPQLHMPQVSARLQDAHSLHV